MRISAIVILSIICCVAACKPLAQREEVSTEQMLTMQLPKLVNIINQMMERAIEIGKFGKLRDTLDRFVARKNIEILEKAFNRQIYIGRKAAVIKMFDSYVNDDALKIRKTIANIAEAESATNLKRQLRKIKTQIYEMQGAWIRRSEVVNTFSRSGADSGSEMRSIATNYRQNLQGVYQTWILETEGSLNKALRSYVRKSGIPINNSMQLRQFLPTEVAADLDEITKLIRRIPQSD